MGGGIFEMRGDGRFTDSLIYNNGPGAWPQDFWKKRDINEMLFGIKINGNNPKILRTQLQTNEEVLSNLQDYSVDEIIYFGAYPSSRLQIFSDDWTNNYNFNVNITALSCFKPYNSSLSTTPGVIFVFDLINNGDNDIIIDALFNYPDDNISFTDMNKFNANGFVINKDGTGLTSGNITMGIYDCISNNNCNAIPSEPVISSSLNDMWNTFSNKSNNINGIPNKQYSLITNNINVPKNSIKTIVYTFSYYFPYRTWDNITIGQYYSNIYTDSNDVNTFLINNINDIINNTNNWHKLMYSFTDEIYSDLIKDFMVNQASYLVRTSMFLNDARWRQLEAFDCDQVEPPHVGFYRKLPYQLFFTDLDQNIITTLYCDNMVYQNGIFGKMGIVSENFGGSCSNPGVLSKMDTPNGAPRGDDNPVFLLDIYMNWKWANNGDQLLNDTYQYAKYAVYYMMDNAITNNYSLPYKMVNTFDEHGTIGDINSYNAVIYIVSLYAIKEMSQYMKDISLVNIIDEQIGYAKGNLTEYVR